jgi:hypothetical protein
MRSPTLDPMAGERARRLRSHTNAPPRISDPTDSRYGKVVDGTPAHAASVTRIVDPTDPACGETAN